MWTTRQIEAHKRAAVLLGSIMNKTFRFIRNCGEGITEFDVQQFILREFRKNNLQCGKTFHRPMVAFGRNTAEVIHIPTERYSATLRAGMPVVVDIWGKLGNGSMPLADITWVGFYGESVPEEVKKVFRVVVTARDAGIEFICGELKKGNLPLGRRADAVSREVIEKAGLGDYFVHYLGHVLGTYSPHGMGRYLDPSETKRLKAGFAYTIEPGVYMDGKFGMRSEMDFLITPDLRFEITTPIQKRLIRIL